MKKKLIIGISGASGFIYGVRLLEILKKCDIETHLVISKSALLTKKYETNLDIEKLKAIADVNYNVNDVSAAIASGSFKTDGMIIAPCSMKTLAEIASGVTSGLISRAADVILKERRKLVLMVRETPFTAIHLKNMLTITECGGIIAPPVPAFYTLPQSIDDLINHSIGRVLDLFDIETNLIKRWPSNSG